MFPQLFSGFDSAHAQENLVMVCTTFSILILPFYLILHIKMLDLAGKGMLQRGVNHGWHCF